MYFSLRQNTFSRHFIVFSEYTWNDEGFEEKIDCHNYSISETSYSGKRGYLNAKQVLFQNTPQQSTY